MQYIMILLVSIALLFHTIKDKERYMNLKAELNNHVEMPVKVQTGYFISHIDKLNIKSSAYIYLLSNNYIVADTINLGGEIEK